MKNEPNTISLWPTLTKFRYGAPISESFMELRMQPRTEPSQHCVWFDLSIKPRTRLTSYRDHLGNLVHHFDVPAITLSWR